MRAVFAHSVPRRAATGGILQQNPPKKREGQRRDTAYALVVAMAFGLCASTSAMAQYSNNTIKIGVLTDTSSYLSDVTGKGSIAAAQLAIDDFGGKMHGVPIELVSADHQNKPDTGAAIARQWYDQEGVDVIADVPASGVAIAVQSVTREKNKIALLTSASTEALTNEECSPN